MFDNMSPIATRREGHERLCEVREQGWCRMGTELPVMFVFGFLVATILWLGLWFLWARPAEAAALRVKDAALQVREAAVRDKETVLLNCVAAKDQRDELRDKLQAENQQLDDDPKKH